MNRLIVACLLPAVLSGCGITAAVQGAGQQIGPTVTAIETDIYAIALAKYKAAQMFKAEIDGTIVLPPLPPPVMIPVGVPVTPPPPVVVTPPPPSGGPVGPVGPVVTPSMLR